MADILLIQPPIRDFYLTAKRTIPYGLACIAASLIKEGFSVEILDGLATSKSRIIPWPEEMSYLREYYGKADFSPFALFHSFKHFGYSFQHLGEAAKRSGAFLVGISSLFTAYSTEALQTAEAVRAAHPHCRIVVGGHHATEMPERVLQCGAVDFVLRGEGEVSMPKLARALREKTSLESVPGIVHRKIDRSIRLSPPALMEDLDLYPLPAMSLIQQKHYQRSRKAGTVVMASRGCPMQCTYCSMGASSCISYRRRSVDRVLHEIEVAVLQQGAGFIDFEDENISLQKDWFLELLKGIRELCRRGAEHHQGSSSNLPHRLIPHLTFGHDTAPDPKPSSPCWGEGLGKDSSQSFITPELRAMNGLFPPTLDEEVVKTMKEAGFKTLNLSLGTTSQEQLRSFRRPDVVRAFDAALSHAEKYGLEAVGYIIVGAPGQTAADSISDLLFLASRRVLAGVSVYYPSPGSVDFKKCEEAGILPSRLSLMRSTAIPISHTTTREESVTLLRLGRILNFIKLLQSTENSPIAPSPLQTQNLSGIVDRMEKGRILLQSFLHDGIIRGVSPEGEVYTHKTSHSLCKMFIAGLKKLGIF
ncbi:B12-binding domain-containing radical SAM protein [Desulforhabdus amnigena]|jgi:radical SAM superfamily enzyme YgiQ (UPF0313 family)|uniref:B12-binding domain-containing radical SAM protein n=1 Tax=Desulforhabdus amnigena TaxID=40218 RepID=A0A9W6FR22_9BACT|nr:radical SAM protein [Desulforhabdus amnigena]GLI33092.1 hypothetical protein DAMNIGENAA_05250 [Desulforhabdus amnigena]